MRKYIALAALFITALHAGGVFACGESLFRVGRGVSFREYSAPLPGNLIVVASTDSERAMAERLAAAGHDVHVVADPGAIGAEIRNSEHPFDLVIAYFSQSNVVKAQLASADVAFLPVVHEGSEEAQATQTYDRYLDDQASVKRFLKTIHAALRAVG